VLTRAASTRIARDEQAPRDTRNGFIDVTPTSDESSFLVQDANANGRSNKIRGEPTQHREPNSHDKISVGSLSLSSPSVITLARACVGPAVRDALDRGSMASDDTDQTRRARVRAAIDEASDEVGLEIWYRSCAEPLIELDDADFPSCCGANCEPCSLTLIEVALRARVILRRQSG
jgi:hypothetical protein